LCRSSAGSRLVPICGPVIRSDTPHEHAARAGANIGLWVACNTTGTDFAKDPIKFGISPSNTTLQTPYMNSFQSCESHAAPGGSAEEYAEAMLKVLALEEPARLELAAAAREQAAKFSTALFETVRSPLLASQQQDSGQVLHRAVRDGTQPSPCESTAGLRPSSPPRCSRRYAALSLRVNSRTPAKFSTALFEMVRSPLLASQQQDSGQVLHRAVRDGTQPSPCESTAGLMHPRSSPA
jgi:hypothetical protein